MGIVSYAAGAAVREGMRHAGQQQRQAARHAGTVATRQQAALEHAQPPTPDAPPLDGVKILGLLSEFHLAYDYWDAPEYADLIAAWEVQAAAMEDDGSPIWRALGRLIVAGMHGTGKDGTMAQIAMATGSDVLTKVTYAGIRDCIAKDHEAAILNEAQMTFGTTGKASSDVRVVVNAHVKGNKIRDGRHGKMDIYGQVAMAGLPSLLTGRIAFEIKDTLSRCFVLWKVRKPKGHIIPEVTDAKEAEVRGTIVPAMREWCAAYRHLLKQRSAWFGAGNPTGLPDLGGGGRGNDQLARPLLTVCDVATYLAHREWREAGHDIEDFPPELDWRMRIRRALVFVSGAPVPEDDGESPLDSITWADSGEDADWDMFAPAGPESPSAPEPAPAATYRAACAVTFPNQNPVPGPCPAGPWDTLTGAQAAIGDAAGAALHWQEIAEGVWGATIAAEDGPVFDYAISAISSEEG